MESGRKTYSNNKSTTLRTSPLARIWPNALFADDPLEGLQVGSNGLALALHLFPKVHSDSFYAHLISFLAVLSSGAILNSSIWRHYINLHNY